ncbi:hypothetical protein Tco_1076681, partial [Tanacetum coccineum]
PYGKRAIGTKWVYKNKKDERGIAVRNVKSDILLVQVYVDDIIFRSTKKELCNDFEKLMHKKFQMSSIEKYMEEILKKFGFSTVKTTSTPIETSKPLLKDTEAEDVVFQVTPKVSHLHVVKRIFRYLKGQPKLGLWYPKDSPFDLEAYTDSDYAGASLDRKSTTGGCQFLGRRLISWQCKKQTIVANSTTKAEYVAAASCCGQVLWIQNQMLDYGYNFMNTKIFIDNESTICIVKNPVFHSKTKHIEIRHHFIRDSNEKKLIQMIKIHTDHNVADLLTKAFDVGRFQYLIATNDEIQVSTVGLPYYCNMKRGFSGEHTPLFPSMLAIQEEEGEGSRHPSKPQPPPSTAQPINEEPIPNVTSEPIPNVPDEAVYMKWDDRVERATTTAASLDVEQASGNINRTQSMAIPNVPLPRGIGAGGSPRCQEAMGGSIAQTRSERVPTPPHDSPLLRVHTLRSDEGSMTLQEFTILCTTLSKKVESLEADLKQTKQVYGAAYTKLIIKVKKLEKIVKTSHSRGKAKI